ncbi:MAG: hypothetical protein JO297_18550 [Nitrososphaeraceae archaeon]|nr:hypothetical protein [Nitrososphaeraceae archaeon]
MSHPSKLERTIVQKNKLKSFMRNTNNKKEYRRLLAILQKESISSHSRLIGV